MHVVMRMLAPAELGHTSACGAALPPDVSLWSRLCTAMYLSTVSAAQSEASGCWSGRPDAHAETAAAAAAAAGCMCILTLNVRKMLMHVTTLHVGIVGQWLAVGSADWAVAERRDAVAAETMRAHRCNRLWPSQVSRAALKFCYIIHNAVIT
jgi:hypothetical protein